MKGERDGAGGTLKGDGRGRGGGFGNWSMANAILLFTLRGNFRQERPSLSTIQTPGLES